MQTNVLLRLLISSASSKSHSTFILILPKFSQDPPQILPRSSTNSPKILLKLSPDPTQILTRSFSNSPQILNNGIKKSNSLLPFLFVIVFFLCTVLYSFNLLFCDLALVLVFVFVLGLESQLNLLIKSHPRYLVRDFLKISFELLFQHFRKKTNVNNFY